MAEKGSKETASPGGALAKTGPAQPPALAGNKGLRARGGEEVRSQDIQLPVWRFLQPTSNEVQVGEFKPGLLRHSVTGEVRESVEFLPIYMRLNRVMFDKANRKGAPVCRSIDMIRGTGCSCGCGSLCRDCKYKDWQPDGNGKREPPACSETYNFVSVTLEDLKNNEVSPVAFRFAKSSLQAGKKIASNAVGTLSMDPTTKEIRPLNMWAYVWKISLIARDFPSGKAYVANVERVRKATDDEAMWAEALYQEISRARKIEITDDEEAPV